MQSRWSDMRAALTRVKDAASRVLAIRLIVEYVLPLACIGGLFFVLYGPALGARFVTADEIALATRAYQVSIAKTSGFVTFVSQASDMTWSDIHASFYRPVFWSIQALEIMAFGQNMFLWRLTNLIVGTLTCFMLYRAARNVKAPHIAAGFFVLWVMIASGESAAIWAETGPTGWTGMLFTAASLWCVTRAAGQPRANAWDVAVVILVLLAGLTKENYLIVFPAVLLFRLALHKLRHQVTWRQSVVDLRAPLIAGAAIVLARVAAEPLLLSSFGGYGARYAGSSTLIASLPKWPAFLADISAETAYYIPLLVGLIVVEAGSWRDPWRTILLLSLALGIVWLLPQLVLFHGRLVVRYAYPGLIAFAAVNAAGLSILWTRRLWAALIVCLAVSLFGLRSSSEGVFQAASQLQATSVASDRMISCVESSSGRDQAVVVAFDPTRGASLINLLELPFIARGLPSPVHIAPVFKPGGRAVYAQEQAAGGWPDVLNTWPGADSLQPSQVGAIVLMVARSDFIKSAPAWYVDTAWQVQKFTEPVSMWSPFEGTHQVDQVRINILIPAQAGSGYRQVCQTADSQ